MPEPDWVRIQTNTFRNWANTRLKKRDLSIKDLDKDLSNGLLLMALAEVLTGGTMPKHAKAPKMRSQSLDNMSICMKFLKDSGLKMVNIGVEDVVDGNHKIILGLLWVMILKYQMQDDGDKGVRGALLEWCQKTAPEANIRNFGSDWHSGTSIVQIIDHLIPGSAPDYNPMTPLERSKWASHFAEERMHIPPILSPEDFINPAVDEQSVMTYLACFKNWVAENPPAAPVAASHTISEPKSTVNIRKGKVDIVAKDTEGVQVKEGGDPFEVYVTRMMDVTESESKTISFEEETLSHTFYWKDASAKNAMVGGAYNKWKLVPMEKVDGKWELTVHGLKPRTLYRFKYNVDGEWLVDPEQPVDETELVDGRPVKNNAIGLGNAPEAQRTETTEKTVRKLHTKRYKVEDNGNGTYTAYFPDDPEVETTVSVKHKGNEVGGGPFVLKSDAPHHTTSVATIENGEVKVTSRNLAGAPVASGGHDFKAELRQEGKSHDIPLSDNNNGTYSGTYTVPNLEEDATVVVTLGGEEVTTKNIRASQPPADASNTKSEVAGGRAHVHAKTKEGEPALHSQKAVKAELEQGGQTTPIPLEHDGNGTYSGPFTPNPEENATVRTYLNGASIGTHPIKASQPRADAEHSSSEASPSGTVAIHAKTKEGEPALHSEKAVKAELEQAGKSTPIPLKHDGKGTYAGTFTSDPEEEATVHTYLDGKPLGSHPLKASQPHADAAKTTSEAAAGKVAIHAKTKEGEPALFSDKAVKAELQQSGKSTPVPLKHDGKGTYAGTFTPNPEEDSTVVTYLDNKPLGSHPIKASQPRADPAHSTSEASTGHVAIHAKTKDGEPALYSEKSVKAELQQAGKSTPIPLKHDGKGTYSGSFTSDPEEDATVTTSIEDRPLGSHSLKAGQPRADPSKTKSEVAGNQVHVHAKTKEGEPALYADKHLKAEIQQSGKSTPVPLKHDGKGTYAGTFAPNPEEDATVVTYLDDKPLGNHHVKASQPRADPTKTTSAVADNKVNVTAKTKDGEPAHFSEKALKAELQQSGQTTPIALKNNGDGTYSGQFSPKPEEDSTVTTYLDGKPIGTHTVKATQAPASAENTKVDVGHDTVHVYAKTKDGEPALHSAKALRAELVQNKTQDVPLTHEGKGTYTGTYEVNPEEDAVVNVYLNEKQIASEKVGAIKPRADPAQTKARIENGNTVVITAKTKDGAPALYSDNALHADMQQGDKQTVIPLTNQKDGTYTGTFTPEPSEDARVNVSVDGKPVTSMLVPASKPKADPSKTTATAKDGKVVIVAKTADDKPAVHSDGHFAAQYAEDGQPRQIPLTHDGKGTYSGTYQPNIRKDHSVHVTHQSTHLKGSPFKVAAVPAKSDASQSTVQLKDGTAHIQSKNEDGGNESSGGQPYKVFVEQAGKKNEIPVTDNKDGTYTSGPLNIDPEEDATIHILSGDKHTKGSPIHLKGSPNPLADASQTQVESGDGHVKITGRTSTGHSPKGDQDYKVAIVQNGKSTPVPVKQDGNGNATAEYKVEDPYTDHEIHVTVGDKHAGQSPYKYKGRERPPADAKLTQVVFEDKVVRVVARDAEGKPVTHAQPFTAQSRVGTDKPQEVPLKNNSDGTYTGQFTRNPDVDTTVEVLLAEKPIASHVFTGSDPVDPSRTQVTVGPTNLVIKSFDHQGQPYTHVVLPAAFGKEAEAEKHAYHARIEGPQGKQELQIVSKSDGTLGAATDYKLEKPGTHNVHVTYGGRALKESPYAFVVNEANTKFTTYDVRGRSNTLDSRPAWFHSGDQYTRYLKDNQHQHPPHYLYVYFPADPKIQIYNIPTGQPADLNEFGTVTAETQPSLPKDLQRLVPTTTKNLLLYNARNGATTNIPITGKKQLGPAANVKETANKRWKRIVPFDIDGQPHVLYHDKSGNAQLRKFNGVDFDVVSTAKWSENYERICPVQFEDRTALYLYNIEKKTGTIAFINAQCQLEPLATMNGVSKNWKHIVPLSPGYMLLYEKRTGFGMIQRVSRQGAEDVKELRGDRRMWTQCEFVAHNRQVIFFENKTGEGQVLDWDPDRLTLSPAWSTSAWKGAKLIAVGY